MSVIIIEDDGNKLSAIIELLKSHNISESELSHYSSFHSGMQALISHSYDLLLLDMSMPAYDISPQESGGRPLPLAGRDILFMLRRRQITIPTIVVTQYEDFDGMSLSELNNELICEFPAQYKGYVYYSTTQDNWKFDLSMLLNTL